MKHKTTRPNNSIFLSVSILLCAVFISFGVVYASGGFNVMYRGLTSLFPKFPNYQKIQDISDYSSAETVLPNQPKLSYASNVKYIIVESSDFDCSNCASFHGYKSTDGNSSYKKLKRDYIETGLVDYIFTDQQFLRGPEKHIAAYCAAEQSSSAFFEYKEQLYINYDQNFDLAKALNYANSLRLDGNKFQECFNSKKYQDRVKGLSQFNSSVLQASSTPTFTIMKVEDKEVVKPDGSREVRRFYTKVDQIVGNANYELTIKPKLDEILEL